MSRLKTTAAYLADIRAAAASGESIDHLEALLRLMQRAESSGRDRRTPSKARRNVGLATDIVVRARDDRYQALQAGGGDAELDTSTGVRRSGREVKQRKIYGDTDDSNSSSDEAAEEGIDEAPKGAASDAAIAGLERGDKKDHRHVQMAIQIRAKVEHRASRSSRTAGQTNDRPHALPKLAHRRLGRTRAPSPRAASSV